MRHRRRERVRLLERLLMVVVVVGLLLLLFGYLLPGLYPAGGHWQGETMQVSEVV